MAITGDQGLLICKKGSQIPNKRTWVVGLASRKLGGSCSKMPEASAARTLMKRSRSTTTFAPQYRDQGV